MANINVTGSPSTSSNNLTVNYTTDAENITNMEITKDNTEYIAATTFTGSSAIFDVSTWDNGTYTCTLRMTHTDSSSVVYALSNITNITVEEGKQFYINYSTNKTTVKHEVSWDGGNTYWDKTSDVISVGNSHKFLHDSKGSVGTYNMAIRCTADDGSLAASNIFILTITKSVNPLDFTQYKRLNDGVLTDTTDNQYWSTTEKYNVTAGATYTINLNHVNYVCICYYNSTGDYIGYVENNTSDWSIGALSTTFTPISGTTGILICGTGDNTQIIATVTQDSGSGLLDSSGAYIIDDFSSGAVDDNKWTYELGYVRNGETQRYTNTNAEVNNGILALRGLKDSYGNWTSSSIISKGRFSFMYGKIEARVRPCNYNGAFGAFWTLGDSFEFGYKEWSSPDTLGEWWAYCGEFDIMEFYNGKLTCGTFFNAKEESGRIWYNNYATGDWHTFGMEWLEDGTLKFSIDGDVISTTSATTNRAFHIPHFILLNQAIGASGGTPDSNTTEITQYVDWVKYYPANTENVVLYTSDFSITVTDHNDNNCVVRATYNDNCINKVLNWSCDNTDIATVHSGFVCTTSGTANGTINVTATSPSGISQTIQLTVVNGKIQS